MTEAKPSGLRPPTKIGRPCCTIPPRPAVPPSPSRSTMREMDHLWETHGRRLSEAGLRRGSDNSVVLTEDTDSFIIGDRVWVGGTKPGAIAYIGETKFAPGEWAGVVLDEPIGKNDGSVAGCRYFQCEPKRGVFARLTRLTRQPLPEGGALQRTPTTPTSPLASARPALNRTAVSPSLNTSTTSLASTTSQRDPLRIGERVIVSSSQGSKAGVLRYIGPTEFAAGEWCGVELDEPHGKNDGSVDGKRYFECRPRHGLFAASSKVSRSPSSRRSICTLQRPSGAGSLRRTGSRESLGSVSSVASVASRTHSAVVGPRRPGFRTSTPARSTLQETLKEKQQEIEMLRKERDLERDRVTKAASQADQAEQSVLTIKQEYDKYRDDMERAVREAEAALTKLLEEKSALALQLEEERRKSEDLLFRFEEESVNKDDIQKEKTEQSVINTLHENRIKDLEKQLSEERERVIQLERESVKLFEAEEELARLRNELNATAAPDNAENEDVSKRNHVLEGTIAALEKEVREKTAKEEDREKRIRDLEEKLNGGQNDIASLRDRESFLRNDLEEIKRNLQEKCSIIENMGKEHETNTAKLNDELRRAKDSIQSVVQENEREKELLKVKYKKITEEQVSFLKMKLEDLATDSRKQLEAQRYVVEQLKEDSVKDIQRLSQELEQQSSIRDAKINEISLKLKEREVDNERLTTELSNERDLTARKNDELVEALQKLEDLTVKLKLAEEKNLTLSKRIEELQSSAEDTVKVIQEKQKLEDDVASLRLLSTNVTAQVDKLNDELKQKDKELDDLRKSAAAQIEELSKRFQNEIDDKSKYINDVNADLSRKSLMLENLEKEIAELKSVIISKDAEIKNLMDKTSDMQNTLSLSEGTIKNLESQLHALESNVGTLNQKLARADEKVLQVTAQKEKLESDIANMISSSADSSEQLQKFNQDLRSKEKEVDEYRDKAFQLENALKGSEGKANDMEQELTKSASIIKDLQSELESVKCELSAAKTLNEKIIIDVEQHRTREQELLANVEKVKTIEEDSKLKANQLLHLTEELRKNQEKLSDAQKECHNLQAAHNEEKLALQMQVNNLEESLMHTREEVKVFEKTKIKLEADQSALRWSIEELTEKLKSEKDERTELQSSYEGKISELKQMQEKITQLQAEKEVLLNDKDDVAKKFDQSTSTTNAIIGELRDTLNAKEETIKGKDQDILQLKSECDLSASKVSELNDIIQSMKEVQMGTESQVKSLQETIASKEKEVDSMLKEKSSLEESIKSFGKQVQDTQAELCTKNRLIDDLKMQMEDLKKYHEETVAKLRTELDDKDRVSRLQRNADDEKEKLSLQSIIDSQKNYIDTKESVIKNLQIEIKNMQDQQRVQVETDQQAKSDALIAMQSEVNQLQKENEKLLLEKTASEKALSEREEKIHILSGCLKEKEKETEMNIQNLTERLSALSTESAQLIENKNRLEHENKEILAKWTAVSTELKSSKEDKKNNVNAAGGDVHRHEGENGIDPLKLQEEYEMAKSQIDFLNSVIVDMQRKNETLLCKVEVLEMGIPANEADDYSRSTLEKRTAAPRMFCDICDQFDLHETEDCPVQAQDFQDHGKESKSPKKPPVERPYCENCEVFGHDTRDCDDTETF